MISVNEQFLPTQGLTTNSTYLDNLSQQRVAAHQSCEEVIFAKGKEMTELITLRSGFLECDAKVSCRKGTTTSSKFLCFPGLMIKYTGLRQDCLIRVIR